MSLIHELRLSATTLRDAGYRGRANAVFNGIEQLEAMQAEIDRRDALLTKVLDYYEGRKPFDFHRLTDDFDRSNQAFDAWQEIAGEIRASLGQGEA